MRHKFPLKKKIREIAPEEIFLDASNLPDYEAGHFQGRVEKPVSRRTIFAVGIFFIFVVCMYGVRAYTLQVVRGASFASISQNNILDRFLIIFFRFSASGFRRQIYGSVK